MMHYLTLEGSHYQMGVQRGRIFQENHITFPLGLDGFQLEHGRKSEKILREFFPEVCEEIKGVTDTTGNDYLTFVSWMLCMGCCMYNLERNIPAELRGCTAFACASGGQVIYGRNNDLPPYLKEGCKSEIYAPANGNRFYIATSSFINGEEGMNEHGLAAAMTFVMTRLEQIRPGLNSCFIVRYLLEKADSADSALKLLLELPAASNCNILIADRSGEMIVVECTPDEKRIRKADCRNRVRLVCAVNCFISDEMKGYDGAHGDDYQAERRYHTVTDSFRPHIRENVAEAAQRLLRGDYGFMCQYDDTPDFETVWSSVFDLNSLMIYRAEGDPRRERFVTDSRLCNI